MKKKSPKGQLRRRKRKKIIIRVRVINRLNQNQQTTAQTVAQVLTLLKMLYQYMNNSPGAVNESKEVEKQVQDQDDDLS